VKIRTFDETITGAPPSANDVSFGATLEVYPSLLRLDFNRDLGLHPQQLLNKPVSREFKTNWRHCIFGGGKTLGHLWRTHNNAALAATYQRPGHAVSIPLMAARKALPAATFRSF